MARIQTPGESPILQRPGLGSDPDLGLDLGIFLKLGSAEIQILAHDVISFVWDTKGLQLSLGIQSMLWSVPSTKRAVSPSISLSAFSTNIMLCGPWKLQCSTGTDTEGLG